MILGTLVGLAILEIGVRVAGLAPEIALIVIDQPNADFESSLNPVLKYVPRPGSPGISSYGIRDAEYPFDKDEGTFRVVVVGDSIAFGYCTNNLSIKRRDTFAKVLERNLKAQPPLGYTNAEVINVSVSGYDTIQEVEFFRTKGVAFDPDLVLVAYCLNDSVVDSWEMGVLVRTDEWSDFEEFTRRRLRGSFEWSHLARTLWYRWSLFSAEVPAVEDEIQRRIAGFEQLRELAEDNDFETLVTIFPDLIEETPYPKLDEHRAVAEDARSREFAVLDLLSIFQKASQGRLTRIRGRCWKMHPDETGHQIAARAMEQFIRENYGRSQ